MAVRVITQRKAVQIGWDTSIVRGKWATIEGEEPDGFEEKLHIPNDGNGLVTYGGDFSGPSKLRISGSKGGVEEGTIEVV